MSYYSIVETYSDNLKKNYEVRIDPSKVQESCDNAITELAGEVKIKGFRKGKVPRSVIEHTSAAKDAINNAMGLLCNRSLDDILSNKMYASLDIKNRNLNNEDGSISYELHVELMPEKPNIKFSDLIVKKYNADVTEDDIKEIINKIMKSTVMHDGPESDDIAEDGDLLTINMNSTVEGNVFALGTVTEFKFILGDKDIIPELNNSAKGLKKSEKVSFTFKLPDAYQEKSVAGKEVNSDVEVLSIVKGRNPTKEEEILEERHKNVEDLYNEIRNKMLSDYRKKSTLLSTRQMIDYIVTNTDTNIQKPESITERIISNIAIREGIDIENDKEKILSEHGKTIHEEAVMEIFMSYIANEYKITVSNQEINGLIFQMLRDSGIDSRETMKFYLENEHFRSNARKRIVDAKTIEEMLKIINYEDVKLTCKEFDKIYKDLLKSENPEQNEDPEQNKKIDNSYDV